MARIRSLKPGFFLNEDVASLPFEWRLLFAGLWTQADRAGRLEDRPARLKASLFPYDALDVNVGLSRLAAIGLIVRYVVDGKRVIAIPTWDKHQQPHMKEAVSVLPAPEHGASTVLEPVEPVRSCLGNGDLELGVEDSSVPQAATEPSPQPRGLLEAREPEPVVLVFPTIGAGAHEWGLTEAQLAEWEALYPGLDVGAEALKALAWVKADKGRRKTAGGMARFLVGWLNRAVNDGRRTVVSHRRTTAPDPRRFGHWSDECRELHGSTCAKHYEHGLRMQRERGEVA